jgi:hypothetical protein
MVARQDEYIGGAGRFYFQKLFTHCVGSALVPIGGTGGLFGSPDIHPAPMKSVECVCLTDMPV